MSAGWKMSENDNNNDNPNPNHNPSIIPVKIADEMRSSYMDYAMSVIVGRALPDVRDGLKPVHRRILYGMYEVNNYWNRSYKKSARVVGDVMGKYHPHGDSSIYDALVRMAQPFSMSMPLVDGQGNFGSVDGDPAAAMRYTEVRMTRLASEVHADIEKETIDFGDNYDGSESEPLVMPTRFPNLLVNGSEGIAVGMATRIPPHNLGEIVTATMAMVDNPDITDEELHEIVPGPDFPTGGFLYGVDGVREAYIGGRGVIRIRAVTHIETDERTNKDTIVVTELPYQVNKARLLEKIAELVRDKAIDGITDLRDESDRTGMRMIIECRRDANSQVILNQLFKKTSLETSFGINMLAIVAGQPQLLGLRDVLGHFIDFRRDVVTRRSLFELREARSRMHILEALKKALDMIDAVIATIRASVDAEEACEGLMVLLEIDEGQSKAILQMRLQKLTNLEINKLMDEMEELQKVIDRLLIILSTESELLGVIRAELKEILGAYSIPRRTVILPFSGEITLEDLIADEQEVVTLTRGGYIKRTQLNEYRTQKRGGKGLKGMETKDEDFVEDVWVTNTHASLLIFLNTGKAFRLKVHELPAGGRNAKGKPIVNLIPVEAGEKVQTVLPFESFEPGKYIITGTRKGQIKKTPLIAYKNINVSGIIGVKVREGDELIGARLCEPADRVLFATRKGQSITFDESDARPMGRNSQGVRGIRLRGSDEVISLVVIPRSELLAAGIEVREPIDITGDEEEIDTADAIDTGAELELDADADVDLEEGEDADDSDDPARKVLVITDQGYGKRTSLRAYSMQKRGGSGMLTIKLTDKRGALAACRLVADTDELILISNKGKLIRTTAAEISVLGRNTQGVRLFNMEKNELVVGVAAFEVDEDDLPDLDENGDPIEDGVESVSADLAEGGDGDDAGAPDSAGEDE
jgi:DNA gyrase subunit A